MQVNQFNTSFANQQTDKFGIKIFTSGNYTKYIYDAFDKSLILMRQNVKQ